MKNALILHGTDCNPSSFWQPSIKKFLEKNGYKVNIPFLPESAKPQLKLQLPFVLQNYNFNEETVIIAHSAGCPLALSVLENIKVKVRKVILVAGYARKLTKNTAVDTAEYIIQEKYNWNKIKKNSKEFILINSDNDPWGCDDQEGRFIFDQVGGTLIIRHGEGHMGSDLFNQPYKEFPLLEKLLEL